MNSVCSCGLELEKRGREVPNVANSEEEISSMAYLSVSEFNYSSNDAEEGQTNQPPLVPPLTLKVQTDGKLRESKENLEKCIQTDDWLGHCMDDEVNGAMKNVWCESSAIQNYLPCYSSTGSAEPPFQGEGGITDNLPRITDQVERHGGVAASTSWCNDATDENRRNRELKVDSKSLKVSQERKNKNQEYLSGRSHNTRPGEFLSLKGGGQDQSFSNRGRGYKNRESVTYWNDKDAKPEKIRPRDDMRNTIDKKESNFFVYYPTVRSEIRTYTLQNNHTNFEATDVFNGRVPDRVVVGLVYQDAFSGNYAYNPFNFPKFDVSSIKQIVEGEEYPYQPLQLIAANGQLDMSGYHRLISANCSAYRGKCMIKPEHWGDDQHTTLYMWDNVASGCADSVQLNPKQEGRVKIAFTRQLSIR